MYYNAPINDIKYLMMFVMYVCIHHIDNGIANGVIIIIYLFVSCDGASQKYLLFDDDGSGWIGAAMVMIVPSYRLGCVNDDSVFIPSVTFIV